MRLFILDTGALLSQWTLKNPDFAFMTTQSVVDEIRNRASKNRVQNLLSTNRLRIESPNHETIRIAEEFNIELINKKCIYMFAEPVAGFHKFHRALVKLFGRLPK